MLTREISVKPQVEPYTYDQEPLENKRVWKTARHMCLVAFAGAAAGIGVGNAVGVSQEVGPAEVTTRFGLGDSTFNLGVAAAKIDTPGPISLDASVTNLDFLDEETFATSLGSIGDIEAIANELLSGQEEGMRPYALLGAMGGFVLSAPGARSRWRGEYKEKRHFLMRLSPRHPVTLIAVGALASGVVGPSTDLATNRTWEQLQSTVVEGFEIPSLETSGTILDMPLALMAENERYYDGMRLNFIEAYQSVAQEDAERGLSTFVFETDLHCNTGMMRVIAETARQSNAEFVLSGGDITMSGTDLEAICTEILLRRLDGTPYVFVLGNHDSAQTGEDLVAGGAVMINGSVVDIAGLRIVGDSDPNRSRIGTATRPRGDETEAEYAERMAQLASVEEPDISVVHDPSLAVPLIASGDSPLVLSGHRHEQSGPIVNGETVTYAGNNSGGTGENTPSYGPLGEAASLTLFYYDSTTSDILGYRVVNFTTRGRVIITEYELLRPELNPPLSPQNIPQ